MVCKKIYAPFRRIPIFSFFIEVEKTNKNQTKKNLFFLLITINYYILTAINTVKKQKLMI